MALLKSSVALLVSLTVLTGLVYPLLVTAVAAIVFPHQAGGSPVVRDGVVVGSELIGQRFSGPRYFWGRPSATAAGPYDAAASTGSNLAPSNPALAKAVAERIHALRTAHPGRSGPVPVDLVTASASGLDPHISPAAALYQVERVAAARGLQPAEVKALIERCGELRTLGVLGEPRVNVLLLNLALEDEGVQAGRPTSP